MYISNLYIYPIKSLGGIELTEANVTERGLAFDRRWVLADAENRFITQRQYHQLAFFSVELTAESLLITNRQNGKVCNVPFEPKTGDFQLITIWEDAVVGQRVAAEVDTWFSEQLGIRCSLFYQPDTSIRPIDTDYAITGAEHTSFSDGYPILLVSQESLDDLNSKVTERIEMQRFRPNIVVSGATPFQEDTLQEIKVGLAVLYGVKPCARCVLTTINPETGQKGAEPLQTLATYRKKGNKVLFGQNVVVHQTGKIKVGDEIY